MTSRWIDIQAEDGKSFKGYLSLPPTGSGPGLMIIQEIWGVNAHIRAVADQYASNGYVVLAPDVFWRSEPGVDLDYNETDTKKAYGLMNSLDNAQATQDLDKAAQALRALPECTGKVGIVGFCMGGRLAYLSAANGSVDAAVAYYGGGIDKFLDQADKVKCPILFHYAEKDAHIPPTAVSAIKAAFANASNASFEVHPDTDHGFNCWGRPSYNQKTAALAHGQSLAFLSKVL